MGKRLPKQKDLHALDKLLSNCHNVTMLCYLNFEMTLERS